MRENNPGDSKKLNQAICDGAQIAGIVGVFYRPAAIGAGALQGACMATRIRTRVGNGGNH